MKDLNMYIAYAANNEYIRKHPSSVIYKNVSFTS